VSELAAAMHGYAALGVQHLMFHCEPYTPDARQRLAEALQLYRRMSATDPGAGEAPARR
jgi:hypothetical protein